MTRTLRTESGSVYEFDGLMVRRTNDEAGKRGDGEWQSMQSPLPNYNLEGGRVFLTLESLAHLGTDDYGTPVSEASEFTTRITTPVVFDSFIEEEV